MSTVMTDVRFRALAFCLPWVFIAPTGPTLADPGVALLGGEFQVNSFTSENQSFPDVAMAPDGRSVVVWESVGQDGDGDAVVARFYDADGSQLGDEFIVNTYTTSHQSQSSIEMAPDGSFIILWRSSQQDGDGWGSYAQRFSPSGDRVGDEFRINEETTNHQEYAFAAFDGDGHMMVVWESEEQDGSAGGIYGRAYDSAGQAGDEFRVNATTSGWQNDAEIAALPSGFVVVWESLNVDSDFRGVVYRRYAGDGTPLAGEQLANVTEAGNQNNPVVAIQPDGSFIIVWESDGQDGSNAAVIARLFALDGTATSGEIQLNQTTPGDQEHLSIAADGMGGYVAIWDGEAVSGGSFDEIWGRRILADGRLVGDEFRVNTSTSNRQVYPAIAAGDDGVLMAVWHSWTGDGSGTRTVGQRLWVTGLFSDGFESGDVSRWSQSAP
ncbi:MAG: hypothetical protein AAGC60_12955 [Acidobacteriota bacterium]